MIKGPRTGVPVPLMRPSRLLEMRNEKWGKKARLAFFFLPARPLQAPFLPVPRFSTHCQTPLSIWHVALMRGEPENLAPSGGGEEPRQQQHRSNARRPPFPAAGTTTAASLAAAALARPAAGTTTAATAASLAAAALARGRLAATARAAAARLIDAAAARLDAAVAAGPAALRLTPRFFEAGWGDLNVVDLGGDALLAAAAAAADRSPSARAAAVPRHDPAAWYGPAAAAIPALAPAWKRLRAHPATPVGTALFEASFPTPAGGRVYDALPLESRTARAWLLVPEGGQAAGGCVVHLPGTGDQGLGRRLALAAPLAAAPSPPAPIAAIILESPFYGARRPPSQVGAKLGRVSDLLALGRATVEEALALLAWAAGGGGSTAAAAQHAFPRLGVCGLSMGGVHAGMVAGLAPGPLGCAALLAPRSAAAAFCDGALWPATAWRPLTAPSDGARRDVLATVLAAAAGGGAARAAEKVLAAVAAGAWPLGRGGQGGALLPAAAGAPAGPRDAARAALAHVLETYTDVTRLPPPAVPSAAIVVGARADAYVARASVAELAAHWPGAEVRWVPGGHVSAYLTQGDAFRSAIRDCLERVPPLPGREGESLGGKDNKLDKKSVFYG